MDHKVYRFICSIHVIGRFLSYWLISLKVRRWQTVRIFYLLCHFSVHFYLCFWKYFEEMATCVIIQVYSSFIVRKIIEFFIKVHIIHTSRCKSGTKTKHGHTEFVGLVLTRWDSLNKARKRCSLVFLWQPTIDIPVS